MYYEPGYFFLTIENGVIVVKYANVDGNEITKELLTAGEFDEFFMLKKEEHENNLEIMCSSSMDFPDEYTDKPEVIELAGMIRNG